MRFFLSFIVLRATKDLSRIINCREQGILVMNGNTNNGLTDSVALRVMLCIKCGWYLR